MYLKFLDVSSYFLLISSLIVAAVGIFYWNRLEKFLQVFTVLKIASFLCDGSSKVLLVFAGVNPNHISIFYGLAQLLLLFWFYYLIFEKPSLKKPFLIVGIGLTLLGIGNWIFSEGQSNALYTNAIDTAALLGLCVYYFYKMLKTESEVNILSAPLFWINTGLLIYLSGTLLLFLSADYIIRVLKDDFALFLTIHNFLGVIANGLFFYGIWLGVKPSKNKIIID
ncbi:MAG TPA: hypothetical protein DIS90_07690 [Cytophagales bacterium]|nr:hypothetical protein [Cytophagales bacterium]